MGSGPSQLALAILAHYLKNDRLALGLEWQFKCEHIAPIQADEWTITSEQIVAFMNRMTRECPEAFESDPFQGMEEEEKAI